MLCHMGANTLFFKAIVGGLCGQNHSTTNYRDNINVRPCVQRYGSITDETDQPQTKKRKEERPCHRGTFASTFCRVFKEDNGDQKLNCKTEKDHGVCLNNIELQVCIHLDLHLKPSKMTK